jgi:serine/threonine protein kinase
MGSFGNTVLTLQETPDRALVVFKSCTTQEGHKSLKKEAMILQQLKHPLIIGFHEYIPRGLLTYGGILTEFIGNGSLEDHFGWGTSVYIVPFPSPTRVAKIVVGIALAMRYIHDHDIVHSNLNPSNILLDWDGRIRIRNFRHSRSLLSDYGFSRSEFVIRDVLYLAPECYDGVSIKANDVFSFGLLLYELVVGKRAFSPTLFGRQIAFMVAMGDYRPEIPVFVSPAVAALIENCWAPDPDDRLTFSEIFNWFEAMAFKLKPGVKSSKIWSFVNEVTEYEVINCED